MPKFRVSLISLSIVLATIALTATVNVAPAAAEFCLLFRSSFYMLRNAITFACEELLTVADGEFELFIRENWLNNGAAITTATPVDTAGETLFENISNGAAFLCSALFEGTVSSSGAYELTKVFDLSGKEIKELEGSGILCSSTKTCENSGDIELWPVNLPFKSSLYAATEQSVVVVAAELNGKSLLPGYHVLCLVLGVTVEESCETAEGSVDEVLNVTGGVELMGVVTPLATCGGSAENGLAENSASDVETISLSSGTLSVS